MLLRGGQLTLHPTDSVGTVSKSSAQVLRLSSRLVDVTLSVSDLGLEVTQHIGIINMFRSLSITVSSDSVG